MFCVQEKWGEACHWNGDEEPWNRDHPTFWEVLSEQDLERVAGNWILPGRKSAQWGMLAESCDCTTCIYYVVQSLYYYYKYIFIYLLTQDDRTWIWNVYFQSGQKSWSSFLVQSIMRFHFVPGQYERWLEFKVCGLWLALCWRCGGDGRTESFLRKLSVSPIKVSDQLHLVAERLQVRLTKAMVSPL